MASLKSAALFISGIAAGIVIATSLTGHMSPALAQAPAPPSFKDVPSNHVAAGAVSSLKKKKIITGYPDDTYRGDAPVTRYELAVIVARFAQYYDTSKAPLAAQTSTLPAAPTWAAPSRQYLADNQFVPPSSPLFKAPGTTAATANLTTEALSSTVDRLIDRSLPVTQH